MKHTLFTVALLAVGLVAALSSLGLSQKADQKRQNSIEQEILKLEKEWFEAYYKSDADIVNRIEADDYVVSTGTSGEFVPKERQIARIRTRDEATRKRMAATMRTLEQAKVRAYGNVVVVNGISISTRRDDPGATPVVSKALYTGVWVKRDGRWQIVNGQFTTLPEPAQGGK
ncbi:MAG TPA: nuclear transport factor 2 family protein [Blastocatellia bacterium]|nr:nuclear transport factor 2 family protein [Blastocatellia bacterium]